MKRKEKPEALEFFAQTYSVTNFYIHFSHKLMGKEENEE